MTKILFVCSENRLRSPTAEALFSARDGIEAVGAGTNPYAGRPVTAELIGWADLVLVMEERHRQQLEKRFPAAVRGKKIGVLDIPDIFPRMDPLLIALLEARVPGYLRMP